MVLLEILYQWLTTEESRSPEKQVSSARPMDRHASWISPGHIPRGRRRSPPPVQALEYPTQPQSPVLVLPARQGTPPEDRLALAWPSQDTMSQEIAESASIADAAGREMATYHTRAIVTVSPSGETTMHIQSSYYSLRSPAGGSGGTRLYHSPSSGGSRGYSTPGRSVKQLTFPNSPGNRFGGQTPRNSSFGTPKSSSFRTPHTTSTGSPKPGRSLLFEPSSSDTTIRRRNLPALPYGGGGDAKPKSIDKTKSVDSHQQDHISDDEGDAQKKKTVAKEYKGILEQDHPEEQNSRGRGLICTCICTLIVLLLLILIVALILWIFIPFGDPVLKIGMAPTDAISLLRSDLDQNVFGQHIANNIVVSALQGFLLGQASLSEPVILSFHGSTGVGKTHMADILARHFMEDPDKALCSHTFLTDFHIPSPDLQPTHVYQRLMENWVNDQLRYHRSCKYLFLIFDELRADTPAELAIAMSNVLYDVKSRKQADDHAVVVIIMSDIGMHDINTHMSGVWDSGSPRENTTVDELVLLIKNAALYMDRYSQVRSTHYIQEGEYKQHQFNQNPFSSLLTVMDTLVPFLPLECSHVKLCIIHDAMSKGLRLLEEDVTWVADQLTYFPSSSQVFSLSGCKKVSEKVDLLRNHFEARQDND